jgi:hypothetical protein
MTKFRVQHISLKGKFFIFFILTFVGSRLYRFSDNHSPVMLPDSPMYLPKVGDRFGHVSFLGNQPRPFNVTFLYAILEDPNYIFVFQSALSALAWVSLFYTIYKLKLNLAQFLGLALITLILGLSGPVMYWDQLIQSDSLAFSSSILSISGLIRAIYRIEISSFEFFSTLFFMLSLCLIRPFCMPLMLLYIFYRVSNSYKDERERKREFLARNRFKRIRKTRRVKVVDWQIKLIVGMSVLFFTVFSQNQMDLAWGKELAQTENVKGRSLQQLGVVQINPYGAKAVANLQSRIPSECTQSLSNAPPTWWGEYVHKCTKEARELASKLQPWLISTAIKDPLNFFRSYYKTVLSSFANLGSSVYPIEFSRIFFGDSSNSNIIFGANWEYSSIPTVIVFFFLCLFSQVVFLTVPRPRNFLKVRSIQLALTAVSLFGSLFLSAYFSPSDTTRVSSAPMIAFTIIVIFWAFENLRSLFSLFLEYKLKTMKVPSTLSS